MTILDPRLPEWRQTILEMPPLEQWFMGRYPGGEVMPTYILPGVCLSVRMKENELNVCQHTKGLPPEWRP
jgi:hypothetical protein